MKVKTCAAVLRHPARAIAVAAALFVGGFAATPAAADENGINRFAVRNCTAAKMLVCAYDKTDNILAIPYHAKRVAPGEKERFSCGSAEHCKVFIGTSQDKIQEVLDTTSGQAIVGVASGVVGNVGLAVGSGGTVTMYLIGASGAGLSGAVGLSVAGGVLAASAAVGTVFAVVKTIDGVEVGKVCKEMMHDQEKIIDGIQDDDIRQLAKDSRKVKVEGSWPKYKDYRMVTKQGVMVFEKGNDC